MRRALPTVLVALAVAAGGASWPWAPRAPLAAQDRDVNGAPQPPVVDTADRGDKVTDTGAATPPATQQSVDLAIARGIEFLVKTQNKDGSWGSPASNLYDIYAPSPGAYYAFQGGASALALSALVETGGNHPGAKEATARGAAWLLANHKVRRASVDALYNTWTHMYALEAFARLATAETDPARREQYAKAMVEALDMLQRYEFVEGGWGYYDFNTHTQKPGTGATSFSSATGLVALKMAADAGLSVPERLSKRALWLVEQCRKPDNAFCYSFPHRFYPTGGINKVKGSLARTPACLLALKLWDHKVTPEQIVKAFDDLEKHDRFLRIARKYPQPHETWYQNSGYFCFYGYYYASQLLSSLEPERRAQASQHIANYLVPLQEQDGSFWDYQLYGYHKAYGTGYVLMTLARCRGGVRTK